MPANYTAIRDGNVTLPGAGGDLDTDLTFDASGVRGDRSSILSYRVNPSQDGVKFTIQINDTEVRSRTSRMYPASCRRSSAPAW